MNVYTIGHSTRSIDEFISLLREYGITGVADVRTIPRSRRHPHFAGDRLSVSLPEQGIVYRHFPTLGGLRKPRKDSPNAAWRNASFRGYADHMLTRDFEDSLEALLAFAREGVVAVMCAEAKWWQCHRQLIADSLVIRGADVRHILSERDAPLHQLTPFARTEQTRVTYPALV
jgi:uncharacterized protein (DUF488 family)